MNDEDKKGIIYIESNEDEKVEEEKEPDTLDDPFYQYKKSTYNPEDDIKKNKKSKKGLIIPLIIVLLLIGGGSYYYFNIYKVNRNNNVVDNSVEKKIASILLKEYYGDKFLSNRITKAYYNSKRKELEITYNYNVDNDKEYITLNTNDFVNYNVNIYESSEDGKLNKNSFSSNKLFNYRTILNVVKLAKEKGYEVGELLDIDTLLNLYGFLKNTEIGENITLAEQNGFKLVNYYASKGNVIGFVYKKDNYYIDIHNADNICSSFIISGSSEEKIFEDSTKVEGEKESYKFSENVYLNTSQIDKVNEIIKDYLK